MSGVVVSYSGVHQAYQAALAAQEAECLEKFLCSVYDGKGFWGGVLSSVFGERALLNRKVSGLDTNKVEENVFPLLFHRVKSKILKAKSGDWLIENSWFDYWSSRRVRDLCPSVVFGTETCCMHSFAEAKRLGATTVLDCPQVHPSFLDSVYKAFGDSTGIKLELMKESPGMSSRRLSEYGSADWMITYSDVHKRSFVEAGFQPEKIVVLPLWADTSLWYPNGRRDVRHGRLRALFVGGISLRKGVPFLIESMRQLHEAVELTMVGSQSADVAIWLRNLPSTITILPPTDRRRLREIYCSHDVLILPSLVDAFGFVAMEAMACGLPVVVSENCGVPVPCETWRVPILDSVAICERLKHYLTNPQELLEDGEKAFDFALNYSPDRFRRGLGALFSELC